ncbi:MAG: universal stress protein [Candidatus Melainabacteria bacterium]|nr:universal stress protein [Candidatus Melainabacteria bacterium]
MKVLIAVDGSDCSNKAVEALAERQWKQDDQFMVISVVQPISQDIGVGLFQATGGTIEDQQYAECARYSGTAASRLQSLLGENQVEVKVVSGLVADSICYLAESWEADLVVLGSHGRKGIAHLLLGSVAEEVLKKSPCSVEVVKLKQKLQLKESETQKTKPSVTK